MANFLPSIIDFNTALSMDKQDSEAYLYIGISKLKLRRF